MNSNGLNENKVDSSAELEPTESQPVELPRPQPPAALGEPNIEEAPSVQSKSAIPDQPTESETKGGPDRNKMILLGGGLAAALLLFAFTLILARSPQKRASGAMHPKQAAQQEAGTKSQSAIAPIMNPIRKPDATGNDGQLTAEDINRMRSPDGSRGPSALKQGTPSPNPPRSHDSLAAVPSFADTQQRWEEPRPYGEEKSLKPPSPQQEQALLKETSLVFVRTQTPGSNTTSDLTQPDEALLDVTPGSRILAKLQTEISTADATPVVAQVEYTYAIGDQVVLPAGAQIYGHLQQADRSGNVSVKFEEVELLDHRREKIEAVGKSLDMGPIKGKVTGRNTGKNLLVRSVSGIGSTMAMVFGNNTSTAFSEDDLIRERLAENIGTAGDSEIMNMALNSREFVSVPAETRIYIVFTKHEENPATLHKVTP